MVEETGGSALTVGGEGQAQAQASTVELFDYWKKSEDIAMHFNELIIAFRLKALGGLGVGLGLIGGVFAKGQKMKTDDWMILAWVLLLSLVIWFIICRLDRSYYSRLLQGTIDEILSIETRASISLSKRIEEAVQDAGWWKPADCRQRPQTLVLALYLCPGVLVLSAFAYAVWRCIHGYLAQT